ERYEQKRRQKDHDELRKEREARDRIEERDYQNWVRDQERSIAKWEQEQQRFQKEQEAEANQRAEEETEAREQAANLAVFQNLDDTTRCEHAQIVAGSGAGKTTLIEY